MLGFHLRDDSFEVSFEDEYMFGDQKSSDENDVDYYDEEDEDMAKLDKMNTFASEMTSGVYTTNKMITQKRRTIDTRVL